MYNPNQQQQQQQNYYYQQQQQQQQQKQKQQEELLRQVQEKLSQYAQAYELELKFPAILTPGGGGDTKTDVGSSSTHQQQQPPLRTSKDLLQLRLFEAGVPFDIMSSTSTISAACLRFITDLERTDCYDAIQIQIGKPITTITPPPPSKLSDNDDNNNKSKDSKSSSEQTESQQKQQQNDTDERTIEVVLHEKKWYKLNVGGRFKANQTDFGSGSGGSASSSSSNISSGAFDTGNLNSLTTDSFLPVGEFECTGGLRNIFGVLDTTHLQYTIDTKSITKWSLVHSRPLYSIIPENSMIQHHFLSSWNHATQYQFTSRAVLDTLDHEYCRGYKEYQRLVSLSISNMYNVQSQQAYLFASDPIDPRRWYTNIDWTICHRDVIPRRHIHLPHHFDASPAVVEQAGPSTKHSFHATIQYNHIDNNNSHDSTSNSISGGSTSNLVFPTNGYQLHSDVEVATPPGDTGFVKGQVSGTHHIPITQFITFHTNISFGYLKSLSFGGLCNNNNNSNSTSDNPSPATIHLSDRFYVGGPGSLRGFVPSGIGPRASVPNYNMLVSPTNINTNNLPPTLSSSATDNDAITKIVLPTRTGQGGNALGGDFYYTATCLLSTSLFPSQPKLAQTCDNMGIKLFAFASAGTCVNIQSLLSSPLYYYNQQQQQRNHLLSGTTTNRTTESGSSSLYHQVVHDVLNSSRLSAGVGIATTLFGPKLEVTYAIPIRYGPRDGRKNFQFGFNFSI